MKLPLEEVIGDLSIKEIGSNFKGLIRLQMSVPPFIGVSVKTIWKFSMEKW